MGKRGPIGKNGMQFEPGVPIAPDWLDDDARTEYARAAKILGGALTLADRAVLAQYAQAWSDISRMQLQLRCKETVIGPQGPIVNPLLKAMAVKERTLMACSARLGFSPVDRARVPKPARTEQKQNKFANL